jgi:hypothetical protein
LQLVYDPIAKLNPEKYDPQLNPILVTRFLNHIVSEDTIRYHKEVTEFLKSVLQSYQANLHKNGYCHTVLHKGFSVMSLEVVRYRK